MAKTTYRQCPRCGEFAFNAALGRCEQSPCEPRITSGAATQPPSTDKNERRASEGSAASRQYTLAATLRGHSDAVTALSFGSTSRDLVSGSDDKTVRLWNWASSTSPRLLDDDMVRVWSLAVAPRAELLAIGRGEVGVHALSDGRCIERTPIDIGSVTGLAMSADGKILAAGGADATIGLWRMSPRERYPMGESQLLSGHDNPVRSIAMGLSDTVLATASEADGSVYLWSLPDGRRQASFRIERFVVPVLAMSAEGILAIGNAGSGEISLRKVSGAGQVEPLGTLSGHSQGVLALAIGRSARFLVSGGFDMVTRVWNLHSRECVGELRDHSARISCVAMSDDGSVVASGSTDGSIFVWRQS